MPAIPTCLLLLAHGLAACAASTVSDKFRSDFDVDPADLVSIGHNQYFILEPGYRLVLEGGDERLVITVLDQTRTVDGVETRVVEERETKNGRLVEVSLNYFAIDPETGDVYYFGEEVDTYSGGQVSSHSGAWLSGEDGARFGLMMPGSVDLELRHYQELAPGLAMDRARIVGLDEALTTPAGEFDQVLKVEETTPLEPLVTEYKYYAPGIGLIRDGPLELVEYGAMGS